MLIKYAPIIITGASLFVAIGLHWIYKTSFLLPSLLAAICTSAVSLVCFKLIIVSDSSAIQMPWNAVGFGFGSGFVLALFVGYLMKHAPNLFTKF